MAALRFYAEGEWFSVESSDDREDAARLLLSPDPARETGVAVPLDVSLLLLDAIDATAEKPPTALRVDTTQLKGPVVVCDLETFLAKAAQTLKVDKKAVVSLTSANLAEWGGKT